MTTLSTSSTPASTTTADSSLGPVAVLGAGRVGRAIAHDLAASGAERVVIVDAEQGLAEQIAEKENRGGTGSAISGTTADLADAGSLDNVLDGVAAVISAVPYRFNAALAARAVAAGVHWVDLGGNTAIVNEILALGSQARDRGVCVIPDSGLQPGLGQTLAGDLHRRIGGAESLRILVGGLPQAPRGELRYQLVFNIDGLVNEYHGIAVTVAGGAITEREPLSDVEVMTWPELPELEAFHTSGSGSTLPTTFAGEIDTVEVKTVRYAGHAEALAAIFARVPRPERRAHLAAMLPHDEPDLVVMRIEARRGDRLIGYDIEDRFDPNTGFTAMMRTTGFPASIAAQLALRGEIAPGAVVQERDLPAAPFVAGLRARGIVIRDVERRETA